MAEGIDAVSQGFSQGIQTADAAQNSSMKWASTMSSLKAHQANLQKQQQEMQIAQQQHQLQIGKAQNEDIKDILAENDDGVRGQKIGLFQKKWNNSPMNPDGNVDGIVPYLKSPTALPEVRDAYTKVITAGTPDTLAAALTNLPKTLSQKNFLSVAQTAAKNVMMVAAQSARANTMSGIQDSRNALAGTREMQQAYNNYGNLLHIGLRNEHNLSTAIDQGKVPNSGQLATMASNAIAKIDVGSNVVSQEGRNAMGYDTYRQQLNTMIQKLTADPDAPIPEGIRTGLISTLHEMNNSIMGQLDTTHDSIKAGFAGAFGASSKAVNGIDAMHSAFQNGIKQKYGRWGEEEAEAPQAAAAPAAGATTSNTTGLPPAPAQLDPKVDSVLKAAKGAGKSRKQVEDAMGQPLPDAIANQYGFQ